MRIAYQAILEPQKPSGFFVRFPDIEEAITQGNDETEALFNAEEVLNLTLEGRFEDNREIPDPREYEGGVWVYPSPQLQSALLVRFARAGRSFAELARLLGTSWPAAQRLENPHHSPTLKQLDRAAAALGKRLVLSFEPSPVADSPR